MDELVPVGRSSRLHNVNGILLVLPMMGDRRGLDVYRTCVQVICQDLVWVLSAP